MKLTVRELLESQGALLRIGSITDNSVLKFRLGRVIKQVKKVLAEVEETKVAACEREGGVLRRNGDVSWYEFPNGNKEGEKRINAEYKELIKEEVEIVFDHFSQESFEPLPINSNDIGDCLWLFGDNSGKGNGVP